ncbi:MAG: hypothetical protein R2755_31830 [Acidimicrobiales bacterium]
MTRAIGTALAMAAALAVIEPTTAALLAPLALVIGCGALGAWRLWRLHRVLVETDFTPAMAALDRAELDDDCELATFTALQRAGEYLEIAARLLDDAGSSPDLARRRRILHRRVDSFVFDTEGLGSLASAWAIEASCKDLAERAAMRWRRPAA